MYSLLLHAIYDRFYLFITVLLINQIITSPTIDELKTDVKNKYCRHCSVQHHPHYYYNCIINIVITVMKVNLVIIPMMIMMIAMLL